MKKISGESYSKICVKLNICFIVSEADWKTGFCYFPTCTPFIFRKKCEFTRCWRLARARRRPRMRAIRPFESAVDARRQLLSALLVRECVVGVNEIAKKAPGLLDAEILIFFWRESISGKCLERKKKYRDQTPRAEQFERRAFPPVCALFLPLYADSPFISDYILLFASLPLLTARRHTRARIIYENAEGLRERAKRNS